MANEGSRGGHVVGHTKSGKPVYESHASEVGHQATAAAGKRSKFKIGEYTSAEKAAIKSGDPFKIKMAEKIRANRDAVLSGRGTSGWGK